MKVMERVSLRTDQFFVKNEDELVNSGCFYLSRIKTLKYFNLFNNRIGDEGVMKMLRNTARTNSQMSRWFAI